MTTPNTDLIDTMTAAVTSLNRTAAELLDMHEMLERPELTEDQRLIKAAIASVIEERYGLGPKMDAIYGDLDFNGTYNEALRMAMGFR